ncbi:MAG TPA: alcohol dehydrogenase-like regulatory protein ErcA [Opitutaceae bacterium]|nr:alcohol dehydrogenase-like regulatory protein ErcA [Opitutaceae bacterium]
MRKTSPWELRKFVAPEFVFGIDARKLIGRYARNLGAGRALLVSDAGVIRAGLAEEATRSLCEEQIAVVPFSGISSNPRDYEVMAGVEAFRAGECDFIVAVGGGSVIDAAKGIGIVATNSGHILDYVGVDRVPAPMPPVACIPTTCGSAADVSQFAIVTDSRERVKVAIVSKALVPDVSLVDPCTLATLDRHTTACTGVDAMVHAIEAAVSNAASPLTDLHAYEALRLIATHLAAAVHGVGDLTARGGVMLASLEAGLAFSNASLGCVHALAHSLGGHLDLPHGECNALLLERVVDFNFLSAVERYLRIGEALGLDFCGLTAVESRQRLCAHFHELRGILGITGTLGSRGLRETDVPTLARKAINDPCNATNPRQPGLGDLEAILRESM